MNVCETKASLVYIESFRPAMAKGKPCSKKKVIKYNFPELSRKRKMAAQDRHPIPEDSMCEITGKEADYSLCEFITNQRRRLAK